MLFSAAENALTWLEESFANGEQPKALVDELEDALSYARCHGDNQMTITGSNSMREQQQQHTPLVAMQDALAYAITNAVANGAGWADDITEWARNHRQLRPHPETVSGGDLVRAALKAAEGEQQ
jgi:hypothetical protein